MTVRHHREPWSDIEGLSFIVGDALPKSHHPPQLLRRPKKHSNEVTLSPAPARKGGTSAKRDLTAPVLIVTLVSNAGTDKQTPRSCSGSHRGASSREAPATSGNDRGSRDHWAPVVTEAPVTEAPVVLAVTNAPAPCPRLRRSS